MGSRYVWNPCFFHQTMLLVGCFLNILSSFWFGFWPAKNFRLQWPWNILSSYILIVKCWACADSLVKMVNQRLDGGHISYVDEAMEFGGHLDLNTKLWYYVLFWWKFLDVWKSCVTYVVELMHPPFSYVPKFEGSRICPLWVQRIS